MNFLVAFHFTYICGSWPFNYNLNTLSAGEIVVSKEMLGQQEDLNPDSWHHIETNNPKLGMVQNIVILVLRGQRQEDPWACCPANLAALESSRFSDRL